MKKMLLAAAAATAMISTAAIAAVTFDPATGTGFVGKGDVQLALGLNNAQLQAQAGSLVFTYEGTRVTEVSWICTNSNNENTQERERTITTSTAGLVSSTARVKNQITGFNLNGYNGSTTGGSTTEGPQLNSCPSGPWSLTTPAGDPEVIEESGGLFVNGVAL